MVQLYKRKSGDVLPNSAGGGNVAALTGGGFIVTWHDNSGLGGDPSGFAVLAQRYDASGARVGGEFLVNSTTVNDQFTPTIATLASGRFVVTWTDGSMTGGDTSDYAIRARVFEADGTPAGGEFLVNTVTASLQVIPAVAALSTGGFVIIWSDGSTYNDIDGDFGLKGQRYDAAGARVGGEFLINSPSTPPGLSGQTVLGLAGGGFAVVWPSLGIRLQVFDANGAKVGGPQLVSAAGASNLVVPEIATLGTGFVVSWAQKDGLSGVGQPVTHDIYVQRYDAAGAKLGGAILVNTTLAGDQTEADVHELPGGGFLVVWQGPAGGTVDVNIYGQMFDADGNRAGGEFIVTSATAGDQGNPSLEVLPSGDIVVTYTDYPEGQGDGPSDVRIQILTPTSGPTDILLSDTGISEAAVGNVAVATLAAPGSAVNLASTYQIVSDESGAFRIDGDRLIVADPTALDFETHPSVDVRIRVTDAAGNFYEKTITVTVEDAVTELHYAAHDQFLATDDTSNFNSPDTVIALANGGFAVISERLDFGDEDATEIRVFDATGAPVGDPNIYTPLFTFAGVASGALPGGGFVLAWRAGGDGSTFPIRVQRFDDLGHKVGAEIIASTPNQGILADPALAVLDNGNFLVTWTAPGAFPHNIMGQMFDQAGNKLGAEFMVNTTSDGEQSHSDVVALAGGGFFVLWEDSGSSPIGPHRLVGQFFDAAGTKLGGERPLAENADNSVVTALENGGFLVSWEEANELPGGGVGSSIHARLFDASGATVGAPLTLLAAGLGYIHDVAAIPGGFALTWTAATASTTDAPTNQSGWAQLFDLAGRPVTGAFEIGQFPDEPSGSPAVAALASGDLAFAFSAGFVDSYGYSASNVAIRILEHVGPSTVPTAGPDTLTGTAADDTLNGLGGDDVINGLGGNDVLIGGTGADAMAGGTGNDWYFVDNAADTVTEAAGEGSDRVFASTSYALAAGQSVEMLTTDFAPGTAAINLTGNELANLIFGNDGTNILDGGAGADIVIGFGGDDYYYVDNAADVVVESAGQGSDRVFASTSYALAAGASVELLTTDFNPGTAAINLSGNELANAIFGNDGANILDGRGGADTLVGFGGDDFYDVDNAGDQVVEAAGQGNDRIFASTSYALGAGTSVELLTTDFNAGTNAINLTGNTLANTIFGNAGANILDGAGGADTLVGFGGDDFYQVDNAADVVLESAGQGNDRIFAGASYALGAGVSVEVLSTDFNPGTAAINLTGNELANVVIGNDGANILCGGAGIDALAGNGGADSFLFNAALGTANADTILDFVTGVDKILLDHNMFAGLGIGTLAAGAFQNGPAQDADDRILYINGILYYDADGSGAGQALMFASMAGQAAISAADFTVI